MKIECPNCKQRYEVDDSTAGQTAECECGSRVVIPNISAGEIIWSGKPSFWGYIFLYIVMILFFALLIGVGTLILMHTDNSSDSRTIAYLLLGSSLLPLYGLIILICMRHTTKYSITNTKIIRNYGIFAKGEDIIRIVDIRKISHAQSFSQFLFGIGNIDFDSAGGNIFFSDLKRHKEIVKKVENLRAWESLS